METLIKAAWKNILYPEEFKCDLCHERYAFFTVKTVPPNLVDVCAECLRGFQDHSEWLKRLIDVDCECPVCCDYVPVGIAFTSEDVSDPAFHAECLKETLEGLPEGALRILLELAE